ncbi:MAG: HAD-IA family hydrolase [Oscillospiraceae bacterium]|nr:HAD-IA family hydrolase [Oscillospiraceae bacterium]
MNKFKISTIIYDLDGTVADTRADIIEAVRKTMLSFGVAAPGDEEIASFIGGGARNVLRRALGEANESRLDEALPFFAETYNANSAVKTRLYDGVREILAYYEGKKRQTMATFKSRAGTDNILKHFDIEKYFEMVVTADDVERPKPDPECINAILERFGLEPGDALLVGDTPTDMKTGRAAGVVVCAVDYGFAPIEELRDYSPDFEVSNITEIKKHII